MALRARRVSGVLVVGSGPGGAAVAAGLARRGVPVTLLEQGVARPLRGHLGDMARMAALPGRGAFAARDGTLLIRGIGVGGTSLLNYATAWTPPLERFAALGIDLVPALAAVRRLAPAAPLPDALRGPMARRIAAGAEAAGLPWQPLDKMIDPATCRPGCWRCTYGCPYGAKWSARRLVEAGCANGAKLLDGARAVSIDAGGGRVRAVEVVADGRRERIEADTVVLAAGGIGSPRLLDSADLARRPGLFVDPVVAVVGLLDRGDCVGTDRPAGTTPGAEVPMAGGLRLPDGTMLADMTLPTALYASFAILAGHPLGAFAHRRALTLMLKVPDAIGGTLGARWVDKPLAAAERDAIRRGLGPASAILRAAGARSVFATRPFAAHPGGSCPIGEVVDATLETRAKGLYVCDASVLPAPWGLPPTLTLLALGERLAAHLAAR